MIIGKSTHLGNYEFSWVKAKETKLLLTREEIDKLDTIYIKNFPDGLPESKLEHLFSNGRDGIAVDLGYESWEELLERKGYIECAICGGISRVEKYDDNFPMATFECCIDSGGNKITAYLCKDCQDEFYPCDVCGIQVSSEDSVYEVKDKIYCKECYNQQTKLTKDDCADLIDYLEISSGRVNGRCQRRIEELQNKLRIMKEATNDKDTKN